MNFAKLSFVFFFLSGMAFGLGEEFTETAPFTGPENQTALISQLKQQAVANRLREMMGAEKFAAVEKNVTQAFADNYIVDYKTRRVGADRSQLEVTGNLDLAGLKSWLTLLEAKGKGQSSANLFVLSSSIPGLGYQPSQTAQKVRESEVAQAILATLSSAFQRLNQKVVVADTGNLSLSAPPRTSQEIKSLADSFPSYSGVVWAVLAPCKSCGGMRLDTHVYQSGRGRSTMVRSEDIAMPPSELTNIAKFKALLKNASTGIQKEFEETVVKGGLSSHTLELSVEGIVGYQGFRLLRDQLEKLDYVNQAILVMAQSKSATFETLTSLSPEEFAQRLEKERFTGFRLKTQGVDSRIVSVRYLQ